MNLDDDVDFEKLIDATEGYSGADISNVCREAAMMPMRKKLLNNEIDVLELVNNLNFKDVINKPISQNELTDALKNISKSVSVKDLEGFEKWANEFKSL